MLNTLKKFATHKNIVLADVLESNAGIEEAITTGKDVVQEEVVIEKTTYEQEIAKPFAKRVRRQKNFRDDFVPYHVEADLVTYDEAMKTIDDVFWEEAINYEYDSITFNNTWVFFSLTEGAKPIRCNWIFKKNMKDN